MQSTLTGVLVGFPIPDNSFGWGLLFLGLGMACASVLSALTYFVAVAQGQVAKREMSKIGAAFARTVMLIVSFLAFFPVAVVVRAVKLNVPDVYHWALLPFAFGVLVPLIAHIALNRKHLRWRSENA